MSVCPKCKSKVKPSATVCPKCKASLGEVEKPSGTLDAGQFLEQQPAPPPSSEPSDSTGTAVTMDHSVESVSDSKKNGPDESRTVRLPEGMDPSADDLGTLVNGDSGAGSAGSKGVSGSSGQLKRVWAEAIGSSGKDSKQSLRHERAEASSSVFRRVAMRQIIDANAEEGDGADYKIQDKLGEGGMGIVFSALQTAVNRIVAIKSIRSEKRDNDSTRRQFFYEAEITAGLDHPNIPPIYELGRTADGAIFYSMKLIKGTEWQAVLSRKSKDENLEVFSKIADAVALAHSKNVIHRDLKPANVMLGTFGEVYLTDWGLAINQVKTKLVEFGGTPDFMAPEMARNHRDRIGKASDVYLLGGILFQIVTGGPPHIGRTAMDRLGAASRNEIAPTDKDDPLLEIAYRAMATEPSDRYASVEEMQEALSEVTRHAESISLAHRSVELAESAASSKDYDRFTRSFFMFRDAIEMWGDNKPAIAGLQKARFAYGQCAFDKGDYDLALQTLDRNVGEEAKVYEKAAKAKLALEQREARFKALRRTFAAAVLAFLCISTGLAGFALLKWRGEASQTEIAKAETIKAKDAEANAKNEEMKAKTAEAKAKDEEMNAKFAEAKAKEEEMNARTAEAKAKDEEMNARTAEANAKEEEMNARIAEKSAKDSEASAVAARLIAQRRAAQNQLSDSISKLGKAKLSIEQLDIQGANRLLSGIQSFHSPEFGEKTPKFDTFAWQRANLLTNADLPQQAIGEPITAMDFAPNANIGIVGTARGKAKVLRYEAGGLKIDDSITADFPGGKIDSVAISPNGAEAILTVTVAGKSSTYAWPLASKGSPVIATFLGARSFQSAKYSPDGSTIAAGINEGIWIMPPGAKWSATTTANEIDLMRGLRNVRGRLSDLQWIDSSTILASSFVGTQLKLFALNVSAKTSQMVTLPEDLNEKLSAAVAIRKGNRLLLASNDGKLRLGDLSQSKDKAGMPVLSISKTLELPTKHRASISRLIASKDWRIISISDKEPVAHVWLADDQGDITYDTYLTGVPSELSSTPNLANAQFISNELILGVDDSGTTVAWNVERQKQRRQLTRISDTGRQEEYAESVVGIFGRGKSDQAISITRDGVVDLWNLQTGKTNKIDEQRWSYFGHTPGAEFVDSAVDMTQGVVVTSAKLKNAEKRYLSDPSHDWEFCVWNQASGNMLHRWSRKAETDGKKEDIEPRISLLNDGKEMLISSDEETRIVTLDGREVFKRTNLGTSFAVPNPRNRAMIAMVKRSGFTWLWNRSDANSWETNPTFYREDKDGFPLQGVWSQDGNRFFVAYSDGFLKSYDLVDRKLALAWSSEVSTDTAKPKSLWSTGFHYDMDMAAVRIENAIDRLFVHVRNTGAQPSYRGAVVDFPTGSAKPRIVDEPSGSGVRWLRNDAKGQATLSRKITNSFELNSASAGDRVVARLKSGDHTFVSTKSGVVYDLQDESTQLKSIGRQPMISSTSDRDGTFIVTLHKDGSLWRFELSDTGAGTWKKLNYVATGIDKIQLSPGSKQLAMLNSVNKTLKIVDAVSGVAVHELANIATATWDPTADATLAVCSVDGKLEMVGEKGKEAIDTQVGLANGSSIKSVNFFVEKSGDENKFASVRYLLVQTEDESDGYLQFIELNSANGNAAVDTTLIRKPAKIKKDLLIATSPEDSIFATGDGAGTVTIWFASPAWDNLGALFDLEGHRGANILSLAFSRDGQTLISADSNKRLYGWLSKDKTLAIQK